MNISRTAILVDGDNISPKHANRILTEGAKLGRTDVIRVYVGAAHPTEWLTAPGFRAFHSGAGKNASDLLLSIDAMELALANGITAFAIATSDGDFSHLAHRLRERGLLVLGLGEAKAPACFRKACSAFIGLPSTSGDAASPATKDGASEGPTEFDWKIHRTIAANSQKGAGIKITDLSTQMHREHGVQISTEPDKTWRGYLGARPNLYDIEPRSSDAMVKYRPQGFAPCQKT